MTAYWQYSTSPLGPWTNGPTHTALDTDTNVDVPMHITGLTPSTTYYARVIAQNATGTRTGNIITFQTLASGGTPIVAGPPIIETSPTPGVTVTAGSAEVSTIDTTGKTPADVSNKYFSLDDSNGGVYVWFNVDGSGTNPAPAGYNRSLSVDLVSADVDTDIATKIKNKLDADAAWSATVSGAVVTVTDAAIGAREDIAARTSTLSVAVTTQGADTYATFDASIDPNNADTNYSVMVTDQIASTPFDVTCNPGFAAGDAGSDAKWAYCNVLDGGSIAQQSISSDAFLYVGCPVKFVQQISGGSAGLLNKVYVVTNINGSPGEGDVYGGGFQLNFIRADGTQSGPLNYSIIGSYWALRGACLKNSTVWRLPQGIFATPGSPIKLSYGANGSGEDTLLPTGHAANGSRTGVDLNGQLYVCRVLGSYLPLVGQGYTLVKLVADPSDIEAQALAPDAHVFPDDTTQTLRAYNAGTFTQISPAEQIAHDAGVTAVTVNLPSLPTGKNYKGVLTARNSFGQVSNTQTFST